MVDVWWSGHCSRFTRRQVLPGGRHGCRVVSVLSWSIRTRVDWPKLVTCDIAHIQQATRAQPVRCHALCEAAAAGASCTFGPLWSWRPWLWYCRLSQAGVSLREFLHSREGLPPNRQSFNKQAF